MHIQSFHIDNFGVFSQLSVQGLSEGLTVFLGKNEAGKSTCVEFLRTMLTGYPPARSKEAQGRNFAQISAGRVGQAGGTLELFMQDRGLVHVTRRPDKGRDTVVLSDESGNVLDGAVLDGLLAGVTRDVYRNVFGFSLSELQVFESLKDEGVRHALYGASFGTGLRSPGAVLKELESHMEKLFKVKGSTPFINDALKQLDRVQKELTELKRQCAQYDGLTLTKKTLEEGLEAVRVQKAQCEAQRRQAERQLGVWKQWDEWRSIENALARLEPVVDSFPEDGAGRLERAQVLLQDAARREATQKERYQKLEARRDALVVNELLLGKRALVQSLYEQKASFRKAQEGLMPHRAQIHRAEQQLAHTLAELGPDWSCERIHATNRSLVARSELENLAGHIQSTEQAHVTNTTHVKKANASVLAARHALELAQSNVEHLPVPEALVNDEVREAMRHGVNFVESSLASLSEKEQSLLIAQKTFTRSIAPLAVRGLIGGTQAVSEALPKLEALRDTQENALALAAKVQEARKVTHEIESLVAQAQENEENARGRVERMRQHLRKNIVTSRQHIDVRATAIRALRQMHSNHCLEKDRLAELEQRMQDAIAPEPVKSIFLMLMGSLIIACGLTGLALPIFFQMHTLEITPRLILPLSQWSAYLVVLAGAAFLAGGLPRSGAERKRFVEEMNILQNRVTSMRLGLTHTEGQIQEQCVLAEVTAPDPITLDAVEILLEREREKCATDERMQLDLEQLQAEYDDAAERVKGRRQELMSAQQQEQRALMQWHDCLRAHYVETIPSPDAGAAFFARVEAALVAQASAQSLEQEVAQLHKSVQEHVQKLCAIPAVQDALRFTPDSLHLAPDTVQNLSFEQFSNMSDQDISTQDMPNQDMAPEEGAVTLPPWEKVFAAVQTVLHACREADEALEQRLKATTAVQNCEYSLEMAEKNQAEMSETLQKSEKELQGSLVAWKESLVGMGIDMEISPRMLRTVMECMEKCLACEAELQRLHEEHERMERECQSLVQPLREVLESVGRPLPAEMLVQSSGQKIPYQEDWLKALDIVMLDMQTSHEALQAQEQLQEQVSAQAEELNEAAKALLDAEATIKHLLRLAQTENTEEFFRLAHVRAQGLELQRRRDDLEDALRLAAGDKDLEEFLASFAQREQHECEAFLREQEAQLQQLMSEEQEKMHELAGVSATLHGLEHTDAMAKLRQEEGQIQESIQEAGQQWAQYAVARQMLLQAKQRFEKERQPQVIRMASDIFAKITNDTWKGLTASLEDSSLQVISPYGEPVSPMVLSRGAQEQLYLALRLAYIRNHAAHASALPVIMDDVLVNFDPERAERTAAALLDLSQSGKRHQVLFFTCHPHMADMLQKNHAQSARFIVDNAHITPA